MNCNCTIIAVALVILNLILFTIISFNICWTSVQYMIMKPIYENENLEFNDTIPESCYCEFESNRYSFCYAPPFDLNLLGQKFNCTYIEFLDEVDLLTLENTIDLANDDLPEAPIITAGSDDHKDETREMLYYIRQFWPKHPVIFYDLGLQNKTIEEFKTYCNFDVRKFPFEKFPSYVKNLREYRWKPLVIALAMKDLKSIWYMDSSIRWLKPQMDRYYDMLRCKRSHNMLLTSNFTACNKSDYLLLSSSYHGIYTATNLKTYEFLPTDFARIKIPTVIQAGFSLVARTKDAMDTLKWYVLCALEEECMAPKNSSIPCKFGKDKYQAEPICHR
ncbi:hypothetical protein WR25_15199 isoform C [Diploscapter pachys]|nr:hypothetical protein WR25_15199 isoform C [Diploscapter pachys]